VQPPVQVLGRARRAIAGGSGDQQVPARPQAAPDLGEEGRGMREVLQDQDREDASQRRVGEAQRPADVVHAEPRADLVARGLCPRDLDHARRPVDAHDVVTAPRECQRVRARTAAEVGDRSRRGHHARELTGGPLDQLTMLRLVAPPRPGRALAVVHEAKEPAWGRHGGDGARAAARGGSDAIRELIRRVQRRRSDTCRRMSGFLGGVTLVVSPSADERHPNADAENRPSASSDAPDRGSSRVRPPKYRTRSVIADAATG